MVINRLEIISDGVSRLNTATVGNRLIVDMIEGWGDFEWGMGPWGSPSELSRVNSTDEGALGRLNSPGVAISRVERS